MKCLKNCIKLQSQLKIYVPSTVDINKQTDNTEWVDKTIGLFGDLFGGGTCMDALGIWKATSGELIKEHVTLCYVFCSESDLKKHIQRVYDHCLDLKYNLKQESVALEINGDLYLI